MANVIADIRRYTDLMGRRPGAGDILDLAFTQGIWAVLVYRFGAWVRPNRLFGVSAALKMIYFVLNKLIEIMTGISISSKAVIGKGLYIGHFSGIFIHGSARIGGNCSLSQGVTIGTLGLGKQGAPVIGDNVFIGTGAKVLGGITVGSNVRIGANAVVIADVPDNVTVVGVPAKPVRIRDNASGSAEVGIDISTIA